MSAQVLSPRTVRRVERRTGLNIVRAWAHGGYTYEFVTAAHVHGVYDLRTGTYEYIPTRNVIHYTSCTRLFGDSNA